MGLATIEKVKLNELIKSWRQSAKAFRKSAEKAENRHAKRGFESIAITFEVNAKLLEVMIKPIGEREKGYSELGIYEGEIGDET